MKRSNRLVLLIGVFLAVVAFVGIVVVLGSRRQPARRRSPTTRIRRHRDRRHPAVQRRSRRPTLTTDRAVARRAIAAGRVRGRPSRSSARSPASRSRPAQQITAATLIGAAPRARSATSRCPPACAPWRSRWTRSPASARSSRPATTSTWSSASPATSSRSSRSTRPMTRSPSSRPQQHQRQAPAPGHAGPRHAAAAGRRPAQRRRRHRPPAATGAAGHRPQRPAADRDPRGHAQQAEVIKFAQLDGIDHPGPPLAGRLRRPGHRRPVARRSRPTTTGVTLKTLVDAYGVLPPEVVETVTPAQP